MSIQQILQSGVWLYPRKSSLNFCKNIMEADLLDTSLSGKCIVPSDDNTGGKACGLMFDIIAVPASHVPQERALEDQAGLHSSPLKLVDHFTE